MRSPRSRDAFRRAEKAIPGGVNSPVRAFRAVGGGPRFVARARGSKIVDVDGASYIDYVGSWGPMLLGHAAPPILAAIRKALPKGTSFGAPTVAEVDLAEEIRGALPSCERLRLVSSGTEACMSALRVARGFTKRDDIVKFEGCYHGHADGLLVKAGSGAATFGSPDSAGVPADYARHTVVLPFNDLPAVEGALRRKKVAAVIVEPIVGNMGVVLPEEGYLQGLRRLCTKFGTLLIFDEVMTGFRVAFGGVQTLAGIRPDLTTLGKVIGGGMPLAAYGGRREVMDVVSPLGPVYQAGTLSGNPIAVAAGLAQLRHLRTHPETYARLEIISSRLAHGLSEVARLRKREVTVQRAGSMLTLFFRAGAVRNWDDAKICDTAAFGRFFRLMLDRGIYLPPSQFEAMFVSAAHSDRDIEATVKAAAESM